MEPCRTGMSIRHRRAAAACINAHWIGLEPSDDHGDRRWSLKVFGKLVRPSGDRHEHSAGVDQTDAVPATNDVGCSPPDRVIVLPGNTPHFRWAEIRWVSHPGNGDVRNTRIPQRADRLINDPQHRSLREKDVRSVSRARRFRLDRGHPAV
jgi:hypothetical protein